MKCQKSNSSGRDQQSSRKIKKKHPKIKTQKTTKKPNKNASMQWNCAGFWFAKNLSKKFRVTDVHDLSTLSGKALK